MSSPHDGDVDIVESLIRRITLLEQLNGDRVRLAEGVERLARETGGLNSVLTKVDEQQQRLMNLVAKVDEVEKKAAKKEDIEAAKAAQEHEALEFRKQTLKRVYLTAGAFVAASLLAFGFVIEYQAHQRRNSISSCEARNEQNLVILNVLRGSLANVPPERRNSPSADNIERGIDRFEALIIDCKETFQ